MKTTALALASLLALALPGLSADDAAPKPWMKEGGAGGPGGGPQRGKMFEMMDKNSDGKVTVEEFKANASDMAKQRFERIDENADGKVTAAEFSAAMDKMAKMAPERAAEMKKRAPDFAALDANGDGSATLEEFAAGGTKALMERFEKMDQNGDDVITKDEVEAARKAFGEGRRGPKEDKPEGDKKPTT